MPVGRQRRLYLLGGALLVAAVVVAIAIAVSSGGGGSKSKGGAVTDAAAVSAELSGIAQSGTTLGSASAPVTLTEFADLQCPICQEFNSSALKQLIANEVRQGKVKVVFRNLETATRESSTFKAEASAALAAGKQNKLWNYVELFYRNQGEENSGYVNGSFLTNLAKAVPGLDLTAWTQVRTDSSLASQISTDEQTATQLGFNATPSLLMKGPKFSQQAIKGAAS